MAKNTKTSLERKAKTREPKNYSRYYEAGRDVAEYYMPNLTSTISSFSKAVHDVDNWVKTSTPFRKAPQGTSTEKKIYNVANSLLQEAGKDIREGNILSFKNLNAKIEDLFSGMGDKTFDDTYDAENMDDYGSSSSYSGFDSETFIEGTAISTQATVDAISTSTGIIAESNLKASDFSSRRIVAGTNIAASRIMKYQAANVEVMKSINQNMGTLVDIATKQDSFYQQTLSFYERTENYFNDIIEAIREQSDPVGMRRRESDQWRSSGRKGNKFLENGFDVGEFAKSVWQNSSIMMVPQYFLAMAEPYLKFAGIDVSALTKDSMFGGAGGFSGIRPLRMMFETTPIARQIKKLNDNMDTISKVFFHRMSSGDAKGGFLSFLANGGLLGDYKLGKGAYLDLSNYDKGVARVTGKTLKSIETVIPTYLSNIENDIATLVEGFSTGQFVVGTFADRRRRSAEEKAADRMYFQELRSGKHRNVYDLDAGTFKNASVLQRELQENYNNMFSSAYGGIQQQISAILKKKDTAEEQQIANNIINTLLEDYGNSDKIRSSNSDRNNFISVLKSIGIDKSKFADEKAMNNALEDLFNQFLMAMGSFQEMRSDFLDSIPGENSILQNLFNISRDEWKDKYNGRKKDIRISTKIDPRRIRATSQTWSSYSNNWSEKFDYGKSGYDRMLDYVDYLSFQLDYNQIQQQQFDDYQEILEAYEKWKSSSDPKEINKNKKHYTKLRTQYSRKWKANLPDDMEENEYLSYYQGTDKINIPLLDRLQVYSGHHLQQGSRLMNQIAWQEGLQQGDPYMYERLRQQAIEQVRAEQRSSQRANAVRANNIRSRTPSPTTAANTVNAPAATGGDTGEESSDDGGSSNSATAPQGVPQENNTAGTNQFSAPAPTTASDTERDENAPAQEVRSRATGDLSVHVKDYMNRKIKGAKTWGVQKKEVFMELLNNVRILTANAENSRIRLFGAGGILTSLFNKFKAVRKFLLGEKDKNGYYTGGLLPPSVANKVVDAKKAVRNRLFGTGYTDFSGVQHEAREDYIFKPVKEAIDPMLANYHDNRKQDMIEKYGKQYWLNPDYQKLANFRKLKEDRTLYIPTLSAGTKDQTGNAIDDYDYSKFNPTPHSQAKLHGWRYDTNDGVWKFYYDYNKDTNLYMLPSDTHREACLDPKVLPSVPATEYVINAINRLPNPEELEQMTRKVGNLKAGKFKVKTSHISDEVLQLRMDAINAQNNPAPETSSAAANETPVDIAAPEEVQEVSEETEYDEDDIFDELESISEAEEEYFDDMPVLVKDGFDRVVDRLDAIIDKLGQGVSTSSFTSGPEAVVDQTQTTGTGNTGTSSAPAPSPFGPAQAGSADEPSRPDVMASPGTMPTTPTEPEAPTTTDQPQNAASAEQAEAAAAENTEPGDVGGATRTPMTPEQVAAARNANRKNLKRKVSFRGRAATAQQEETSESQSPENVKDQTQEVDRGVKTTYFWYNGKYAVRKRYIDKDGNQQDKSYYEDPNAANGLGDFIGDFVEADAQSPEWYQQWSTMTKGQRFKAKVGQGLLNFAGKAGAKFQKIGSILNMPAKDALAIAGGKIKNGAIMLGKGLLNIAKIPAIIAGFAVAGPIGAIAAYAMSGAVGKIIINGAKNFTKLFQKDDGKSKNPFGSLGKGNSPIARIISGAPKLIPNMLMTIGGAIIGSFFGGPVGAVIGGSIGHSTLRNGGLHDVIFGKGKKKGEEGKPDLSLGGAIKGIAKGGVKLLGAGFKGLFGINRAINKATPDSGTLLPLIGTLMGIPLGIPGMLAFRTGGKILGQIKSDVFGKKKNVGNGFGVDGQFYDDEEEETRDTPSFVGAGALEGIPDAGDVVDSVDSQTTEITTAINEGIDRVISHMDAMEAGKLDREEADAARKKEQEETDWAQSAGFTSATADYDAESEENLIKEASEKPSFWDKLFGNTGLLDILKIALPIGGAVALLNAFMKSEFGKSVAGMVKDIFGGINNIINGVAAFADNVTNNGISLGALGTLKTNFSTTNPDGTRKSNFIEKALGVSFDSYIDEETGEVVTKSNWSPTAVSDGVIKAVVTGGAEKTVVEFVNMFAKALPKCLKEAAKKSANFAKWCKIDVASKISALLKRILGNTGVYKFISEHAAELEKEMARTNLKMIKNIAGIAFAVWGAGSGSMWGTAQLFGIDDGRADMKMRVVSGVLGAACWGTTIGAAADFVAFIVKSATGIDLKKALASAMYACIADPQEENKLQDSQRDLQGRMQMLNTHLASIGADTLTEEEFQKATNYGWWDNEVSGLRSTANFLLNNSLIGSIHKGITGESWDVGWETAHSKEVKATRSMLNAQEYANIQQGKDMYTNQSVEDMSAGYGPDSTAGMRASSSEHYSQLDNAWKNVTFGRMLNGRNTTIGTGGCGPTALANVARSLTGNKRITPTTVAGMAQDYGYTANGGSAASLFTEGANRLGLASSRVRLKEIPSRLSTGQKLIISGKKIGNNSLYTRAGHIISVSGIKNGKAVVDDPLKSRSELRDIRDVMHGAKKVWAIGKPGSNMGYGDPEYINNMLSMGYGFNDLGMVIDFDNPPNFGDFTSGKAFGDVVSVPGGRDGVGIFYRQGSVGNGNYAEASASTWSSKQYGSQDYASAACFPSAFAEVFASLSHLDIDPYMFTQYFGPRYFGGVNGGGYTWTGYQEFLEFLYGKNKPTEYSDVPAIDVPFSDGNTTSPQYAAAWTGWNAADRKTYAFDALKKVLQHGGAVWVDARNNSYYSSPIFGEGYHDRSGGHAIALYGYDPATDSTTVLDPGRNRSNKNSGVLQYRLGSEQGLASGEDNNLAYDFFSKDIIKRITTFPGPVGDDQKKVMAGKLQYLSNGYPKRNGSGGSVTSSTIIGPSNYTNSTAAPNQNLYGGISTSTLSSQDMVSAAVTGVSTGGDPYAALANKYGGYQYAEQLTDDDSFLGKIGNIMTMIGGIAGNILKSIGGEPYESVFGHYRQEGSSAAGLMGTYGIDVSGMSSHTPRYIALTNDILKDAAFLDIGDIDLTDNEKLDSVAKDVTRYWIDRTREKRKIDIPSFDDATGTTKEQYAAQVEKWKQKIRDAYANGEFVDGRYHKIEGFDANGNSSTIMVPAWYRRENAIAYLKEQIPFDEVKGYLAKAYPAKKDDEAALKKIYDAKISEMFNRGALGLIEGRQAQAPQQYDVNGDVIVNQNMANGVITDEDDAAITQAAIDASGLDLIPTTAGQAQADVTTETGMGDPRGSGASLMFPSGLQNNTMLLHGLTQEQLAKAPIITPQLLGGGFIGTYPQYATQSAGYSKYTENPPASTRLTPAAVAAMGDYVIPMQMRHESGTDPTLVTWLSGEGNYTVGTGWYDRNAAEVLGRIGNAPPLTEEQRQTARNYAATLARRQSLDKNALHAFLGSPGVLEVNQNVQRAMHQQLNNYTLAGPVQKFDQGLIRDPRGIMQLVEFSGIAPATVNKLSNFGDGSMVGVSNALKTMVQGFRNYGLYGKGWYNRINDDYETFANATDYPTPIKSAIAAAGYGEAEGYGDPLLGAISDFDTDVDLTKNNSINRMLGVGYGRSSFSSADNRRSSLNISSTRAYSPTVHTDDHSSRNVEVNIDLNKLENGSYQMVKLLKQIESNTRHHAMPTTTNTTTINHIHEATNSSQGYGREDFNTKPGDPNDVTIGRQKINNNHTDKMRKLHDVIAKSPRA